MVKFTYVVDQCRAFVCCDFLIIALISLAVIGLFKLLLLHSVWEDYMFLEICQLYLGFQISWHLVVFSNFLNPLYFCGICFNFSSFVSDFIYLGPLSFFLNESSLFCLSFQRTSSWIYWYFWIVLLIFLKNFIVIQLQLYAFSPHPSNPPQLNPPPSPTS